MVLCVDTSTDRYASEYIRRNEKKCLEFSWSLMTATLLEDTRFHVGKSGQSIKAAFHYQCHYSEAYKTPTLFGGTTALISQTVAVNYR